MTYLNLVPGDMFAFEPNVLTIRSDLSEYVRGDVFYLILSTVRHTTQPQIVDYVFNTKKGIITLSFYIDSDLSRLFKRI